MLKKKHDATLKEATYIHEKNKSIKKNNKLNV